MILTRILAKRVSRLILLEKDERLLPSLTEAFGLPGQRSQVEILIGDALTAPFDRWDFPYLVISNLPYNISVPLLMKILMAPNPPRQAVLMFQKEVGQRITASVGTKDYGSLTVAVSLLSHAPLLNATRTTFSVLFSIPRFFLPVEWREKSGTVAPGMEGIHGRVWARPAFPPRLTAGPASFRPGFEVPICPSLARDSNLP